MLSKNLLNISDKEKLSRNASISSVQRRLRIGYNRAARIVEKMEEIGIVGELESNGKREVLAPPPPED